MEKIKNRIQNDLILFRMIAVFSMVSTVVILLLTSVLFTLFSTELKNEIYQSQVQHLKQISNTVSFRAEYVNSLLLQVKEDEQISKLFYTTDDEDLYPALHNLDDLRSTVKQLNSIYVYNKHMDRIYNSGENMQSYVNSTDSFTDRGFVEILENIENYPKYTPILRKLSLEWPAGREYEVYVYTYLLYDSYVSGSIRNVVAMNFHTGWMADALSFITSGQESTEELWIINSDRQLVYTSDGKLVGTVCDPDTLPDTVFSQDAGYLITGTGDERQMVVYSTPSRMGYDQWTFVSWNDYASVMKPLEQVRKLIYLICGILFLVSLVAVIFVSLALYEPVRTTLNRVKVLEKENEKKRRIERMLFLRKLFLGDIVDDRNLLKILFSRHQLTGCLEEDIQVALISVDDSDGFFRHYSKHLDEVSDNIESLIREEFLKHYPNLLCVKMHTGSWAVAVPMAEGNSLKKAVFEELNALISEKFNISISMATSQTGHSARDIPYLYSEAVEVHSYRFLWGRNTMITSADVEMQGQNRYEYPAELEKRLLSHLFGGKYSECVEDYEAFIDEIRWFSVDEIRLSCLLLAYAIKAAAQKSMAEATGSLVEFDAFCKKIQTAETIDDVNGLYEHLFREITDKLKRNSKERHETLIAQIEAYVEANYGDINLSMNQISDHVNMSAAYLGRLFKQVTGITFIEYLTKFRLKKACQLLLTTDLTVNDISDRVGFTNSSYFYIIFKKNMECTPNQYRRQYGGSSAAE